MPIYEYLCEDCGTKFEKLMRSTAAPSGVECPSCGESHVERQLSTFSAHANGPGKQAEMPACPGGMCATPGLCGRN
jgi:putative FmdB family regulatory protein